MTVTGTGAEKKPPEPEHGEKKPAPPAKIESKYPAFLEYKPLPSAPGFPTALKAAYVGALVASPVATLAVTGAVKVPLWFWNRLKTYRPFSWIEQGRQKLVSTAKDLTKSVWDTVTYLPRVAARSALNVTKGVARRGVDIVSWTAEKVSDVFEHVPGEPKHVLEKVWDKTTEWVGKIIEAPFKVGGWYLKSAFEHPWRTLTGTALAAGIISYGPLTFSREMVDLIGKAIEAGIKYLAR
jgi:hypothetical protein